MSLFVDIDNSLSLFSLFILKTNPTCWAPSPQPMATIRRPPPPDMHACSTHVTCIHFCQPPDSFTFIRECFLGNACRPEESGADAKQDNVNLQSRPSDRWYGCAN